MSSISSLEFTVGLFKHSDSTSPSARRVIIGAEVMRSTKTSLGDLVALTQAKEGLEEKVVLELPCIAPSDRVASRRHSQWEPRGHHWNSHMKVCSFD
jgi:hypothetical protein